MPPHFGIQTKFASARCSLGGKAGDLSKKPADYICPKDLEGFASKWNKMVGVRTVSVAGLFQNGSSTRAPSKRDEPKSAWATTWTTAKQNGRQNRSTRCQTQAAAVQALTHSTLVPRPKKKHRFYRWMSASNVQVPFVPSLVCVCVEWVGLEIDNPKRANFF